MTAAYKAADVDRQSCIRDSVEALLATPLLARLLYEQLQAEGLEREAEALI